MYGSGGWPNHYKFGLCAGLNIEVDRILEIACIITDGNLTKSVEVSCVLILLSNYWYALGGFDHYNFVTFF